MKFLFSVVCTCMAVVNAQQFASGLAVPPAVEAPPDMLALPPVSAAPPTRDLVHQLRNEIRSSIARSLGLSVEELKSAGRLQDLAEEQDVDLEAVKLQAMNEFLRISVASGLLTQEQAARMADRLQSSGQGHRAKFGGKQDQGRGGKKFGGKKSGGKKFGGKKFGGKKRGDSIEGLREAMEAATSSAMSSAGLVKPDKATATREEMQAFKDAVKASGIDFAAIKAEAGLAFVREAETSGAISAEVAEDYYEMAAKKEMLQGMKQAVQEAVSGALSLAGLQEPDKATATKDEMKAFREAVKASGLDIRDIKANAELTFVQNGEAAGNISPDVAASFYERAARKDERAEEKEEIRDALDDIKDSMQSALASALNISTEELEALDKDAVKAQAAAAGVDVRALKKEAVQEFLAAAVQAGDMTEEEAKKLADAAEQRKSGGKFGGRGGKSKKRGGKKGGRRNPFGKSSNGSRQFGRQADRLSAPPTVPLGSMAIPSAAAAETQFRSWPYYNMPQRG
jgi:polyhydroxyalkanoate synthesis regulator phasin